MPARRAPRASALDRRPRRGPPRSSARIRAHSYSRSVKAYYEARAEEYDDWWVGAGLFEQRDRPGWESERESLFLTLAALRAGADARRRLWHRLPDPLPPRPDHRPRPEPRDARGRRDPDSGCPIRPERRASAPLRGPVVRTRLHEPLLRPSRGGRPRRLPRRGRAGSLPSSSSSTPRSARTSSRSSGRSES